MSRTCPRGFQGQPPRRPRRLPSHGPARPNQPRAPHGSKRPSTPPKATRPSRSRGHKRRPTETCPPHASHTQQPAHPQPKNPHHWLTSPNRRPDDPHCRNSRHRRRTKNSRHRRQPASPHRRRPLNDPRCCRHSSRGLADRRGPVGTFPSSPLSPPVRVWSAPRRGRPARACQRSRRPAPGESQTEPSARDRHSSAGCIF